jgi:DNA polymerase-1
VWAGEGISAIAPSVSAALPPPGDPKTLYLVDLSGYVFRAYHAIAPLSSSKGEVTHAVMGTVNMLQKVVNDRKPALFAVAMDSRTPSFRKSLDPRYKATRPPPPPDLVSQMVRCREVVDAYAIPVFQEDGLEADDLIAAVTSRALEDGLVVVVVSADKDLMQLVRDHDSRVVLWDSMRDRVYGPAEVAQKFGVPPSKLRDLLALTGDSSDNVPGVPSVGPKTAADLLNQFGTLDAIYTHLADVKRPKLREALAANEADARLSRTLVTLKADAEISWDPQALAYGGADVPRLRALFAELEFTRLRDMLDQANGERPAPSPARQGRDGEPNVAAPKAPPRPAPSALVRTQATLLEARALSALVDRARAKGRLGVAVLTAGSDDPMRASLVGVSLAVEEGEGHYLPLAHRTLGAPAQIALADVVKILGPVLSDPNVVKDAASGRFVEHVLERHGMPLGGRVFDPLLASYVLDPESPHALVDLATRELGVTLVAPQTGAKKKERRELDETDVESVLAYGGLLGDVTLSLSRLLEVRVAQEGLAKLLDDVELPLARVLVKLEREGVRIDVARLEAVGERMVHELSALEIKAKELVGHDFSLRSRDQLEAILFDELGLPVAEADPEGRQEHRRGRARRAVRQAPTARRDRRAPRARQAEGHVRRGAPARREPGDRADPHTLRADRGGDGEALVVDPNLQNIPIRSAVGREIRGCFVAPPGARDRVRRLLADRAPRARPPLGRPHARRAPSRAARTCTRAPRSQIFDVPLGDVTEGHAPARRPPISA